jgi:sugar/nucleoside kinase (ribokinase family)
MPFGDLNCYLAGVTVATGATAAVTGAMILFTLAIAAGPNHKTAATSMRYANAAASCAVESNCAAPVRATAITIQAPYFVIWL